MKKLKLLTALASGFLLTTGCMSPNWMRLAPENKDIDAEVNTIYGHVIIHSRVNPAGTNPLAPLPQPGLATPVPIQPPLATPRTTPLPLNP